MKHEKLTPEALLPAICKRMERAKLPESLEAIGSERLLKNAVALDIAYMETLDGALYDDDDAFDAIVDPMVRGLNLDADQELDLCAWIEEYMEAMAMHLEESGLVDWM